MVNKNFAEIIFKSSIFGWIWFRVQNDYWVFEFEALIVQPCFPFGDPGIDSRWKNSGLEVNFLEFVVFTISVLLGNHQYDW